jgi:hypothetical protein
LEIPVVAEDGTNIYSQKTFLDLPSGSDYPCSIGIDVDIFCYYEQGQSTGYGTPTRIYITGFTIPTTNYQLSFRILINNPDIVGVYPSFIFKAFGGAYSAPNTMGKQFMGKFAIMDAFKTYPDTNYYSTGSCYAYPTQAIWQR